MFKIATTPTYTATVTVEFLSETGRAEKSSFDAVFKRLTQTELESVHERIREGKLSDAELAADVLVGWRGVVDEAGAELPFTPANRDRVLDIYPVRPACIQTFFNTLQGARAKN